MILFVLRDNCNCSRNGVHARISERNSDAGINVQELKQDFRCGLFSLSSLNSSVPLTLLECLFCGTLLTPRTVAAGELLFLHLSAQTKWLRGGGGEASVTSSSSSSGHASAAVAFHGLPAFASLSDSGLCPRLFPPQALYFASSSSVCDAQDPAGVYEMVAE